MSVAAHDADDIVDPLCEDASGAEPRARISAYAETETGVHAYPLAHAVEVIRRGRAGKLDDDPPLIWIDIAAPGAPEGEFLRTQLKFHPLAVEDTVRGRQRPKIDRYPGYFFLVMYAARINPDRERMALNELHAFIGDNFVVTVHDHRIEVITEVLARWRGVPERFRAPGVLAHALLDLVVDGYFPVLDHFSERVAELETGVLEGGRPGEGMHTILTMRRELALFRRMVGPERELVGSLLRRDIPFLQPDMLPYFQDVHDHAIRVAEEIDTLRDLLNGAMEGQLSMASHTLNETMRLMAAWSIILMAMAWIAGIYGMNFRIMPETQWRYGYAWALGLMLVVGTILIVYFKRKHWV
ncbi:MAG TPA: magnesium/cobalt transporter CorA [Longimicrobium sp.]|jgi:magnesium transporter|uniref:magnesium/cobalt transporter CorA n=1 Tax=Longimicrobium sp. TaxID=2029185 RepID=UPI002EDBB0E7